MSEMGIEAVGLYNGLGTSFGRSSSSSSRTVCQCCPYGYHIDLGFVEFCDRLTKEKIATPSKTERRERRRQRKSMDVLLGLSNPLFWNVQQFLPSLYLNQRQKKVECKKRAQGSEIPNADVGTAEMRVKSSDHKEPPLPPPRRGMFVIGDNDGLSRAVQDFEATLKRTSHSSKNKPEKATVPFMRENDLTPEEPIFERTQQISTTSEHSALITSMETPLLTSANEIAIANPVICNGTGNSSNTAAPLKNIRDQMAISLEKMKEMEYQVKAMPCLKEKVSDLEKENSDLTSKIAELTHKLVLQRKELDKYQEIEKFNHEKKVKSREVGVLCLPKTREIGTSQTCNVRTVSTEMPAISLVDKETHAEVVLEDRSETKEHKKISLKDLDLREFGEHIRRTVVKSTQTTIELFSPPPPPALKVVEKRDVGIQGDKNIVRDVASLAKPKTCDISVNATPILKDSASSDDIVVGVLCDRCQNIRTKSVGVGQGNVKDTSLSPGVGLANRSKSFDFSNRKQTRSIGISTIPPIKKLTATKQVGTVDVIVQRKHVAVSTKAIVSKDVSTSATQVIDCEKCTKQEINESKVEADRLLKVGQPLQQQSINQPSHSETVDEERVTIKSEALSKDAAHGTSRIPRPTGSKTPVMTRKKFVRQDTYSKTMTSPLTVAASSSHISRFKSSSDQTEVPTEQTQVTLRKKTSQLFDSTSDDVAKRLSTDLVLDEKRESVASTSGVSGDRYSSYFDDGYDYDDQYDYQESNRNSHVFPENVLFQPIQDKLREKLAPSKEMKAAMKVVNDSLHKHPNSLPKHLKTASSIIQQEWFKVSSTAAANPLDVEDYLDSFEEVSSTLLEYVVNMIDNNGNTAMHYAVSHGNFDVVSILLDSKVCNINKANAAGYTCVMLVSLAQVRSDTHREVVRRLFLLADVNVRAKQHGQTALMLAVSHGRLDMVQLLLEAGADPNIQDVDGSTALMCAAEHGHLEIVKQILAHPDCDPSIVDCDGSSALAIAMEAENKDIGVLLYAREHFAPNSRGSSPYTSFKGRRSRPNSSPHPKSPKSPGPAKRSDHTSF